MDEPREVLANALSNYLTPAQMQKLVDEVLNIEKRVSAEFRCKSCNQRQMAWSTVADAKAVASALSDLLTQSFGRASEASVQADPIAFYRLTDMKELPVEKLVATPSTPSNGHKATAEVLEDDELMATLERSKQEPDEEAVPYEEVRHQLYQLNPDGTPVLNKDGSPRKKVGRPRKEP